VTVILDLPFNPKYFEDLQKKCKAFCGTGGTFKQDSKLSIELQGDQRDKVEQYLIKCGFKVKRAGG
jgi:translation initiation factor 1